MTASAVPPVTESTSKINDLGTLDQYIMGLPGRGFAGGIRQITTISKEVKDQGPEEGERRSTKGSLGKASHRDKLLVVAIWLPFKTNPGSYIKWIDQYHRWKRERSDKSFLCKWRLTESPVLK